MNDVGSSHTPPTGSVLHGPGDLLENTGPIIQMHRCLVDYDPDDPGSQSLALRPESRLLFCERICAMFMGPQDSRVGFVFFDGKIYLMFLDSIMKMRCISCEREAVD